MTAQASKPAMTGGCQCGAVRYALAAKPSDASLCSCRMCQKAVGGPFMASAALPAKDFRWTRGSPGSFASSSILRREFCPACGTPLTYRALDSTTVGVTLGSLDDPGALNPTHHVGTESEVKWLGTIGSLRRHTTDEDLGPENVASIVSHQHPDHDTAHWPPRKP